MGYVRLLGWDSPGSACLNRSARLGLTWLGWARLRLAGFGWFWLISDRLMEMARLGWNRLIRLDLGLAGMGSAGSRLAGVS